MKKFIYIPLLIVHISVFAQQDAQYSNFLFNAFAINPANAGLKECLDARAGFRTQWVGFENNPNTVSINAHQQLKSLSNPRGAINGAGLMIESDDTGPSNRTSIHGAWAVHVPLGRKTKISFGLGLGILQYRLDVSQLRAPNPADPAIQQSQSETVFPDIKAGVWLYNPDWFVGFSGGHLTNPKLQDIGIDTDIQPHYNLMAGRIFEGSEKMSYIPAVLFKFTGNSKPALDVNFWADYDNRVALGLGFRSEDMVSGMLKFNFLDYFTLAYAYDFTFSKMRFGSSNSHEIILGITACPRSKKVGFVPCAAYE